MRDNQAFAFTLFRFAEHDLHGKTDNLIKSTMPNSSELSTYELDFRSALKEAHHNKNPYRDIDKAIASNTHTHQVTDSVRQASLEMSRAAIKTSAMQTLISHSIKQTRAIDNFRPV